MLSLLIVTSDLVPLHSNGAVANMSTMSPAAAAIFVHVFLARFYTHFF